MADREKDIKFHGFITIEDGMLEPVEPDEVIAEMIKKQLREYPDKSWKQYLEAQKAMGTVKCCKCQHYEGVHNTPGCAPCSFWGFGGVMWNDHCPRFEEMK